MEIIADQLSKRYRSQWVFRSASFSIPAGVRVAVTGPNGSGKSTMLKVLSGALPPSRGTITYKGVTGEVKMADIHRHVMYAAPYVDLIDEMTIAEAVTFHSRFRPFKQDLTIKRFVDLLGPSFRSTLAIHEMSSGMKQRMRLALAMCSQTDLLMLDEPTTNLDTQGVEWYREMLEEWIKGETVLIASNAALDMETCTQTIHIPDYSSGQ